MRYIVCVWSHFFREVHMPGAISVNDTKLWPTMAESFARFSSEGTMTRETMGASTYARTLDRGNGMDRTGAPDYDRELFGGIVAGKSMDWAITGGYVPRDAFTQTSDLHRGMQTLHMGTGYILNTSI